MQPILYLCVVSKFNTAELEACLTRKPQHIALIVSDYEPFSLVARRLVTSLKMRLPEHQIDVLDYDYTQHPLSGDDVQECQQWVQAVLVPYLQQPKFQSLQPVLNATGGTKAMSLALSTGYPWVLIDYKPSAQAQLQVLKPLFQGQGLVSFLAEPSLPLQEANPLEIAHLYADNPRQDPTNPLTETPLSAALAQELWEALSQRNQALLRLFQGFEAIWSKGRNNPAYDQKQLSLTGTEFWGTEPIAPEAINWLQRLKQLAPTAVEINEQQINLPGNKAQKTARHWRNWVSGDWLEQWVYLQLKDWGIPESAIARNLTLADEKNRNGSQREADLMIHFQGKTYLIEVKADLPPDGRLASLEEQVSSLGERFGLTKKLLFVGPQLRHYLEHNASSQHSFALRCKASDIDLCLTLEDLRSKIFKR